jgi:peptide-N4-(N-acetyl-beta-glucosaminyl)asparagine amidase
LRALDFDARYVLDWTDHVWCEVYSTSQKRWLHADPCENALDKPLTYEHGWGKKLTYVIAFSRHECVDVTWRYSSRHREVLDRRGECDENWLVEHTNRLSLRRQAGLSEAERNGLQKRRVVEVVEFLSPKEVKDGEDIGRQSGSLQWRLDRGEIKSPKVIRNFQKNISRLRVSEFL